MSFKLQKQANKTISEDGGKEKKCIDKVSIGDSLGLMTSDLSDLPINTWQQSDTQKGHMYLWTLCVCCDVISITAGLWISLFRSSQTPVLLGEIRSSLIWKWFQLIVLTMSELRDTKWDHCSVQSHTGDKCQRPLDLTAPKPDFQMLQRSDYS